jgi:hypothetical protein
MGREFKARMRSSEQQQAGPAHASLLQLRALLLSTQGAGFGFIQPPGG